MRSIQTKWKHKILQSNVVINPRYKGWLPSRGSFEDHLVWKLNYLKKTQDEDQWLIRETFGILETILGCTTWRNEHVTIFTINMESPNFGHLFGSHDFLKTKYFLLEKRFTGLMNQSYSRQNLEIKTYTKIGKRKSVRLLPIK